MEPLNNENNVGPIPPHYAVEAGSVLPLSQFTRDLRVERAMFETLELNAERGRWHFNEYAISVPETLSHFDVTNSTLTPYAKFLECLDLAEIDESAFPYDDPGEVVVVHTNRTKIQLPEDEADPLYASYPWFLTVKATDTHLPIYCFTKDLSFTPSVYNPHLNNTVELDEVQRKLFVAFVQDSPQSVRLYIAWEEMEDEDQTFGISEDDIEAEFYTLFADLKRCLRPALQSTNQNRIANLALKRRQATVAKALTGNRGLSLNVSKYLSKFVPSNTRKRKNRKGGAKKSRRALRKATR